MSQSGGADSSTESEAASCRRGYTPDDSTGHGQVIRRAPHAQSVASGASGSYSSYSAPEIFSLSSLPERVSAAGDDLALSVGGVTAVGLPRVSERPGCRESLFSRYASNHYEFAHAGRTGGDRKTLERSPIATTAKQSLSSSFRPSSSSPSFNCKYGNGEVAGVGQRETDHPPASQLLFRMALDKSGSPDRRPRLTPSHDTSKHRASWSNARSWNSDSLLSGLQALSDVDPGLGSNISLRSPLRAPGMEASQVEMAPFPTQKEEQQKVADAVAVHLGTSGASSSLGFHGPQNCEEACHGTLSFMRHSRQHQAPPLCPSPVSVPFSPPPGIECPSYELGQEAGGGGRRGGDAIETSDSRRNLGGLQGGCPLPCRQATLAKVSGVPLSFSLYSVQTHASLRSPRSRASEGQSPPGSAVFNNSDTRSSASRNSSWLSAGPSLEGGGKGYASREDAAFSQNSPTSSGNEGSSSSLPERTVNQPPLVTPSDGRGHGNAGRRVVDNPLEELPGRMSKEVSGGPSVLPQDTSTDYHGESRQRRRDEDVCVGGGRDSKDLPCFPYLPRTERTRFSVNTATGARSASGRRLSTVSPGCGPAIDPDDCRSRGSPWSYLPEYQEGLATSPTGSAGQSSHSSSASDAPGGQNRGLQCIASERDAGVFPLQSYYPPPGLSGAISPSATLSALSPSSRKAPGASSPTCAHSPGGEAGQLRPDAEPFYPRGGSSLVSPAALVGSDAFSSSPPFYHQRLATGSGRAGDGNGGKLTGTSASRGAQLPASFFSCGRGCRLPKCRSGEKRFDGEGSESAVPVGDGRPESDWMPSHLMTCDMSFGAGAKDKVSDCLNSVDQLGLSYTFFKDFDAGEVEDSGSRQGAVRGELAELRKEPYRPFVVDRIPPVAASSCRPQQRRERGALRVSPGYCVHGESGADCSRRAFSAETGRRETPVERRAHGRSNSVSVMLIRRPTTREVFSCPCRIQARQQKLHVDSIARWPAGGTGAGGALGLTSSAPGSSSCDSVKTGGRAEGRRQWGEDESTIRPPLPERRDVPFFCSSLEQLPEKEKTGLGRRSGELEPDFDTERVTGDGRRGAAQYKRGRAVPLLHPSQSGQGSEYERPVLDIGFLEERDVSSAVSLLSACSGGARPGAREQQNVLSFLDSREDESACRRGGESDAQSSVPPVPRLEWLVQQRQRQQHLLQQRRQYLQQMQPQLWVGNRVTQSAAVPRPAPPPVLNDPASGEKRPLCSDMPLPESPAPPSCCIDNAGGGQEQDFYSFVCTLANELAALSRSVSRSELASSPRSCPSQSSTCARRTENAPEGESVRYRPFHAADACGQARSPFSSLTGIEGRGFLNPGGTPVIPRLDRRRVQSDYLLSTGAEHHNRLTQSGVLEQAREPFSAAGSAQTGVAAGFSPRTPGVGFSTASMGQSRDSHGVLRTAVPSASSVVGRDQRHTSGGAAAGPRVSSQGAFRQGDLEDANCLGSRRWGFNAGTGVSSEDSYGSAASGYRERAISVQGSRAALLGRLTQLLMRCDDAGHTAQESSASATCGGQTKAVVSTPTSSAAYRAGREQGKRDLLNALVDCLHADLMQPGFRPSSSSPALGQSLSRGRQSEASLLLPEPSSSAGGRTAGEASGRGGVRGLLQKKQRYVQGTGNNSGRHAGPFGEEKASTTNGLHQQAPEDLLSRLLSTGALGKGDICGIDASSHSGPRGAIPSRKSGSNAPETSGAALAWGANAAGDVQGHLTGLETAASQLCSAEDGSSALGAHAHGSEIELQGTAAKLKELRWLYGLYTFLEHQAKKGGGSAPEALAAALGAAVSAGPVSFLQDAGGRGSRVGTESFTGGGEGVGRAPTVSGHVEEGSALTGRNLTHGEGRGVALESPPPTFFQFPGGRESGNENRVGQDAENQQSGRSGRCEEDVRPAVVEALEGGTGVRAGVSSLQPQVPSSSQQQPRRKAPRPSKRQRELIRAMQCVKQRLQALESELLPLVGDQSGVVPQNESGTL